MPSSSWVRRIERAWHKPPADKLRSLQRESFRLVAPLLTQAGWLLRGAQGGRPHGLERRVVVSLTSHPPRYATLALTLKALLDQSVRPDEVVLWLHEPDAALLPPTVRRLQASGLSIRTCAANLRSYTKIVPQLELDPAAVIVTADDDVRYPRDWLAALLDGHRADPAAVQCHRAHLPRFDAEGRPLPYHRWPKASQERGDRTPLFFTGVGGVLYPPGALDDRVGDVQRFSALCVDADDIWLNWMTRLRHTRVRRVGENRPPLNWLGSQHVALFRHNARGPGNDEALRRMVATYGSLGFEQAVPVALSAGAAAPAALPPARARRPALRAVR